MERRKVIKIVGGWVIGVIAGVYAVLGIPRVRVTDFEAAGQLLGPAQIRVLLTNEGGGGSVDVEIAALRDGSVTLDRFTRTIEMGGSTQREETFEIEAPDRTDSVAVEAHASILPDFLRFD